ncbi:MAG: diguanylate cyclase [Desulfosporosinus sp.]|nr:diguanylate cyclase [Desulfosporosinus sp.]MDA8220585.1 diguanylate cyclase [Desulfitobacterium hafniense]
MKIRHKISLVAISGLFFVVLCSAILLRLLFMNYADKIENSIVSQNFNRAMSVIQREESSLESTVMDWAYWDDTYTYLNGTYSEYVDVNLQDNTLTSLNINYMGFYNLSGDTVFAKAYGIDAAVESAFKEELHKSFKNVDYYRNLLFSPAPMTGLLIVSGQPLLISISPVTTSNREASNNGVIVFCKLIDQKFLDHLKDVLKVGINFHTSQDPEILETLEQDTVMLSSDHTILYIKKTIDTLTSYAQINNVQNTTEIFLKLDTDRFMYRDGLKIINYSSFAFIATFLIISILCLRILEFSVFRRIEKLDGFMNCIRNKKQMSKRISLPGNDEISSLASSANEMLQELDNHYKEIRINEERFKLIMEATNDGYFDTDLLMNKFNISPDLLKYLGYMTRKGYLDYDQVIEIIHPEDKTLFRAALSDCFKGDVEKLMVECRVKKSSGEWLWLQCRGKIVRYDDFKNPKRLIGTISDITQRKNYEAENLYLSQTDMVTTLKNRTFVEVLLEKSDKCTSCNSWIIMGDINGLRLINDTFGHHEGDRLLRGIGEILKNCCSTGDIPARWSGDEFIIFIKDNHSEYVDILIEKIKKECENLKAYQAPISLSWGRANKDRLHTDMNAVIKLAEERMYRNKLLESRSAKSSILSSLEQSLHEKHIETEEHTRRIEQMCSQIGKRMGLSQEELDEVALLSLLHDIGKIGIPEDILLKPDKLTTDEWEVMKTHSEIGYRIAVSTPDLAHVANEILSHHERYDGTGYPQGLKGKEIPKLSRLLAIVDSFDVMTHARQYKEAMTIESAVLEIKSCSGKQFDPDMVEQFLTILSEDSSIDPNLLNSLPMP